MALLGVSLAGCETAGNLLGSAEGNNGPQTALTAPPTATPPGTTSQRFAVAAVFGAPDNVAKQMQTSITGALQKSNLAIAQNPTDKAEYTLRGYVVSAREKTGVKVSYIWDVTDPAGQRLNRITGEETVAAVQGRDPWSAVTPQVIETISAKTATQVSTWAATQGRAPAVAPAAATVPVATAPAGARGANVAAAAPAGSPTTGSIGREGAVTAFVPNVTGAPGDGRISLTSALQRELSRNGVPLASAAGTAYRVEGVVKVGDIKDGKQPIAIDWHVKDPAGKQIGTVSQKNDIQAGSLDGSWGQTADAAAAAASQGIIKLLPKAN